MQPLRIAHRVMLVLPYRNPRFHFIDDPSARRERGIPMAGADTHLDRHLAQFEPTHAMHACGIEDGESRPGLVDQLVAFGLRQFPIRLVAQRNHGTSLVMVAHPTLEAGIGAGLLREQRLSLFGNIEGLVGDSKTRHASAPGNRWNECDLRPIGYRRIPI